MKKVMKMVLFPKVIWDNYCCPFSRMVSKCPSWLYDCENCRGNGRYLKNKRLIMVNPLTHKSFLSIIYTLYHEILHHIFHIFRLPELFHKTLDNIDVVLCKKQKGDE